MPRIGAGLELSIPKLERISKVIEGKHGPVAASISSQPTTSQSPHLPGSCPGRGEGDLEVHVGVFMAPLDLGRNAFDLVEGRRGRSGNSLPEVCSTHGVPLTASAGHRGLHSNGQRQV